MCSAERRCSDIQRVVRITPLIQLAAFIQFWRASCLFNDWDIAARTKGALRLRDRDESLGQRIVNALNCATVPAVEWSKCEVGLGHCATVAFDFGAPSVILRHGSLTPPGERGNDCVSDILSYCRHRWDSKRVRDFTSAYLPQADPWALGDALQMPVSGWRIVPAGDVPCAACDRQRQERLRRQIAFRRAVSDCAARNGATWRGAHHGKSTRNFGEESWNNIETRASHVPSRRVRSRRRRADWAHCVCRSECTVPGCTRCPSFTASGHPARITCRRFRGAPLIYL